MLKYRALIGDENLKISLRHRWKLHLWNSYQLIDIIDYFFRSWWILSMLTKRFLMLFIIKISIVAVDPLPVDIQQFLHSSFFRLHLKWKKSLLLKREEWSVQAWVDEIRLMFIDNAVCGINCHNKKSQSRMSFVNLSSADISKSDCLKLVFFFRFSFIWYANELWMSFC